MLSWKSFKKKIGKIPIIFLIFCTNEFLRINSTRQESLRPPRNSDTKHKIVVISLSTSVHKNIFSYINLIIILSFYANKHP